MIVEGPLVQVQLQAQARLRVQALVQLQVLMQALMPTLKQVWGWVLFLAQLVAHGVEGQLGSVRRRQ